MAQPTAQQQQQQRRRRAVAAAGAAAVGVGARTAGGAAVAPVPAAAVGGVGLGVATAGILGAFVSFLSALREQHRAWLSRELGRYSTQPDDITATIQREMVLEQEFARRAADRLASAMPQALRISDPAERERKIRQLLSDEERFAAQRSEAMAARAIAAVTRLDLRSSSPLGAYWRLGHAANHTDGCKVMAGGSSAGSGRFWPWAVLDRVHPPRHYGCTSSLHGYGEAILAGWMTPSDVPDERAAVRAAAGVVMEQEEADAVLAELDIRDRLLEGGVSAEALARIEFKGAIDGASAAI